MSNYKPLTGLEQITDMVMTTNKAIDRRTEKHETRESLEADKMIAYYRGEIIGLSDAQKIMEKELRRLCNKFQNGSLSISDFGIVL